MGRLDHKIAIITGASSGIGQASAELFAKEGAAVAVFARRQERLNELRSRIEAGGGICLAVAGDVQKPEDVQNCVDKTIEAFGRIDILVNNAGIVDWRRPVVNTDNATWDRVIAVNLSGTFYFCRAVLPHMERQGQGSIVNISSGAYIRANSGAAYTATKYAVVGLSKNIAIQYAGKGIRCNVVCPGVTVTEINSPENMDKFDTSANEAYDKRMDWSIPLLPAIDQAYAILAYCTDEFKNVTGQVLTVDGGCFL